MSSERYNKLRIRFHGMKQRCYYTKNKAYKYYGGRGITICDEWLNDINAFIKWSIKSGFKEDLEIDRIDIDGPYSPDNCRWVTKEVSRQNKRTKVTNLEKKTRVCSACKIEKPFDAFPRNVWKLAGIDYVCKECKYPRNERDRKRRRKKTNE